MKMEMTVESPMDGVVQNVHVVDGQKVEAQDLIVEIEPSQ